MPTTLIIAGLSVLVVLLVLMGIALSLRRIFIVPKSNEAIIRTGGRKPAVAKGGGIVVLPVIHDYQRISLEAVSVSINRTGGDALRTMDKFLAEVEGTMLVRVDAQDDSHILLAAQSLGDGTAEGVERVVYEKTGPIVTDAMRNATMQKTFLQLNLEKAEFGAQVLEAVADDLQKLGLQLVSVTITEVRQQAFNDDDNGVFSAEGRRNAAEIVEKNREETNRIKREAEIKVQEQDVEAREKSLALQLRQEQKEADQTRQVEEYRAEQEAETTKNVLKQQQATAEAEVAKQRAVKEAQIAEQQKVETAVINKTKAVAVSRSVAEAEQAKALADQKVAEAAAAADQKVAEEEASRKKEEAEIERQKAVESAQIEKDKTLKVAQEAREQAVEEAEVARQVAVAEKRAEEAESRAKQAAAEAKQKEAEESIVTAAQKAEAARRKEVALIKAAEESEKDRIDADRAAYVEAKKAEAERDASQRRAEAAKAVAVGKADARKAEAEGTAEAVRIAAEAYASEKVTKAEADFAASENEAKAQIALANAALERGKAEAEARRLLVEAENAVSQELLVRDVAIKALEVAPAVLHEIMDPVGKVAHDVKVLQINGLGDGAGENASVPATILGTGMALTGALPILNQTVKAFSENDDVKEIVGTIAGAGKAALKEATAGVAEGIKGEARE